MVSEYKGRVKNLLFSHEGGDKLFDEGVTSILIDKRRFGRAVELLDNPKNKNIIEIGPYPGTGIYYFGECNKIVGVGKGGGEFANKVEQLGHEFHEIDLEQDVIPDAVSGSGDIVLFMEVIEHLQNPFLALKNINKMLKPGGYLYCTTNNLSYIGYLLKLIASKPILDSIETAGGSYPGHNRYFHHNELSEELKKLDFEILKSNTINFLPSGKLYRRPIFGYLKNTIVKMVPGNFSTHIEILARKKA